MSKQSAGLLLYRMKNKKPEVFLVHMGGPYWAKKDEGAWSIPKGEFEKEESAFDAALREFKEETGRSVNGNFIKLSPIKQKSGKVVHAWALEADINAEEIKSNTFTMEWPPRSGKKQEFPEIDKAGWFDLNSAKQKIIRAQIPLIEELCDMIEKEDKSS